MTKTRLIAAIAVVALALSAPAFAGQRSAGGSRSGSRGSGQGAAPAGRAVPRGPVRVYPGGRPYGSYYYRPYFYRYGPYGGGLNFSLFYGYPYYYGYPYFYGYPGVYGGYPYGYGYPGYVAAVPGRAFGGVRIDVAQRDAEVYADGYYAGIVDDFDGALQHLDLEPGPHHIEVRAEGFEPVAFDVNVEPGRTITYRTQLHR